MGQTPRLDEFADACPVEPDADNPLALTAPAAAPLPQPQHDAPEWPGEQRQQSQSQRDQQDQERPQEGDPRAGPDIGKRRCDCQQQNSVRTPKLRSETTPIS